MMEEDLICTVCHVVPEDRVFQCVHGHILCQKCDDRLTSCPICRESTATCIRSLAAERSIAVLPVTCPDCKKTMPHSELRAHTLVRTNNEYRSCTGELKMMRHTNGVIETFEHGARASMTMPNGDLWRFDGDKLTYEHSGRRTVGEYEGGVLTRKVIDDEVSYYKDGKLDYVEFGRGVEHYDAEARMRRIEFSCGDTEHFDEGGKLTSARRANGDVEYFGDMDKLKWRQCANGDVQVFDDMGCMAYIETKTETTTYQHGRVVQKKFPDGVVFHYDNEVLVRQVFSDGSVAYPETRKRARYAGE